METSDNNDEYLIAKRHFEQKDLSSARQVLDTLLAKEPDHTDALQLAA